MAAVCEVAACGVLAVGRCATCGRAFCTSHRAAVDRCVGCELTNRYSLSSWFGLRRCLAFLET